MEPSSHTDTILGWPHPHTSQWLTSNFLRNKNSHLKVSYTHHHQGDFSNMTFQHLTALFKAERNHTHQPQPVRHSQSRLFASRCFSEDASLPCWPGPEGGGRIPVESSVGLIQEAVQPWTCLEQQCFILIGSVENNTPGKLR